MAKRRIPMRHIREVLRLHHDLGLSTRAIGRSLGLHHTTVMDLLQRAQAAHLGWPLPALDEATLERRLYPGNQGRPRQRPEPEWPRIHADLRAHKGMTLELAWAEYLREHPADGLQYSQFCAHYHRWRRRLDVVLRQVYQPGDKLFVDYAGPTVPVIDRTTGERRPAQIFVAVLGYSNYVYAEAHADQSVVSWVHGHVRAFQAFGGVPACIVPDNLKAAVRYPHPHEPYLHPSYLEMAQYYDTVVVPAGVRKPREKAKAETGVQLVERWVLAVLRHRQFFSVAELNAAIQECLTRLNARPFQKWEGSRETLLAEELLKPLPASAFEPGIWSHAVVHPDYHVQVDVRYYSVPYRLVGETVEVRATATTVEIFHQGERVASHMRAARKGAAVTCPDHRPRHHRDRLDWTPDRFQQWAAKTGPQTAALVAGILGRMKHPEQAYRTCCGLLQLGQRRGAAALEAAAAEAVARQLFTYHAVAAFTKRGAAAAAEAPAAVPAHDNVRGAEYYQ